MPGFWNSPHVCLICQGPHARGLCATCRSRAPRTQTPKGLEVRALGPYAPPLSEKIWALKYAEATRHARPLGRALAQLLPAPSEELLLVPVPLHPERLAERGYNQSALLARAVARRGTARVHFDLLERSKRTGSQARLNKSGRTDNAKDAFSVSPRRATSSPILLVDDVVTTGATLDACALALLEHSHSVVGALCLAIADRELTTHAASRVSEPEVSLLFPREAERLLKPR